MSDFEILMLPQNSWKLHVLHYLDYFPQLHELGKVSSSLSALVEILKYVYKIVDASPTKRLSLMSPFPLECEPDFVIHI